MTPPPHLSSGDLARATGLTARAIRFYEEQGLLRPAVVSEGGHRRYTAEELERLKLIADLRELGLSLCDIRGALELRSGCDGGEELARRFQEVLRRHVQAAEQRLARLRRVKRELLSALETIEERLRCSESGCPCDAAEGDASPRIVRQVSQGTLCRSDAGPEPEPDVGAESDPGTPVS